MLTDVRALIDASQRPFEGLRSLMPLSDYLTANGATNGPIGADCSAPANASTGNMPTLVDGVTFAHVELLNRKTIPPTLSLADDA
jgi:hypothetical protein